MIEALKHDTVIDRVGGRFKLCALVQRRVIQLMEGARPLVDRQGRSDLEVAIQEVLEDKITADTGALDAALAAGATQAPAGGALPSAPE